MSVARKSVAGLMQKTYSVVRLIHTHTPCTHTYSELHTETPSVDMRERRWSRSQRGIEKCKSAVRVCSLPDGKVFKTKTKYLNLLKQFYSERDKEKQPEALRGQGTHKHTHARARAQTDARAQTLQAAGREMERGREIMATSSSSTRASQTKQTSSFFLKWDFLPNNGHISDSSDVFSIKLWAINKRL